MYATAADGITPVPVSPTRGGTPTPVPTSAPSDVRVTLDSLPDPFACDRGRSVGGWNRLRGGAAMAGRRHRSQRRVAERCAAVGPDSFVRHGRDAHRFRAPAHLRRGFTPETSRPELPRASSRPNETRRARPGCGGWPSSPAPPSEPSAGLASTGVAIAARRCRGRSRRRPGRSPVRRRELAVPYRPPANSCVKNSGTDSPSGRPAATPIPTWVTRGSRTAARWPGLEHEPALGLVGVVGAADILGDELRIEPSPVDPVGGAAGGGGDVNRRAGGRHLLAVRLRRRREAPVQPHRPQPRRLAARG